MTLPFSTLRRVTISPSVELTDLTRKAIQILPYGTNSKIGIPTQGHYNLSTAMATHINTDDHFNAWPGENALTIMVNADKGRNLNEELCRDITYIATQHVSSLYPKVQGFTEPVLFKNWSTDPFACGSYSTSTINTSLDVTEASKGYPEIYRFAEPTINGRFIFAGEHTRSDSTRGYMEGAVRSGQLAAKILMKHIKYSYETN